MGIIITAIAFILIFSVLVLVHEFGHFYAAIKSGVKVEEFGFGLPPRIWGVKKGETLYSINAIPFGGFVRLLGEDSRDTKLLKNKRSFIAKGPRTRIMIVIAGVLMNFLLAFALLTFGFSVGMQPLILNEQEIFDHISKGNIQLQPGLVLKDIKEGSDADLIGLMAGDVITGINGNEISLESLDELNKAKEGSKVAVDVERDGSKFSVNLVADQENDYGFELFQVLPLPRVAIQSVKEGSVSGQAGLMAGDVILSVNDRPIYFISSYDEFLRRSSELQYMVVRGNEIKNFEVVLPKQYSVVVSGVVPNAPASEVGIKQGDVIISIDGTEMFSPQEVVAVNKEFAGKTLQYELIRDGQELSISVAPNDDGLIGIYPSTISSFENRELSLYPVSYISSVLEIRDIRYPVWIAPFRAIEESGRLAVVTVGMFTNVVKSIVTQFTVPEGVAGPVGIAQLTHVFIQEGVLSTIRFIALLSLSLAIINIFPFPALDGGRLFFILIEVVIGKRIGAKYESMIHAFGFVLLMLLIFVVTYNDIIRLFT